MISKYILRGVTEYAKRHLTFEDIEDIEAMVGCEVEIGSGCDFFILPDGESIHSDFVNVEQLAKERASKE